MAKETFNRTKPHVNISTVSQVVEDTSGQLTFDGEEVDLGNPDPSTLLIFSAPAQTTPQIATVAYPFDDEFVFDPTVSGLPLTIDFQVDVWPLQMEGTDGMHVTMAILQDEVFIASGAGQSTGSSGGWRSIQGGGLRFHEDFMPVDRGSEQIDLTRPFQFGFAFTGEYSTDGLEARVAVDNMTVVITAVPEPTSIAMVLALGVTLIWKRFRRAVEAEPDAADEVVATTDFDDEAYEDR